MSSQLTPPQFVSKWSLAALSERAASQEHFTDLCRMLGQPTPAEHDATGAEYTFEKGVTVVIGGSSRSSGVPLAARLPVARDPSARTGGQAVSGTPAASGPRSERGFADVWWRGKFAWEYKRKGKYRDLTEAYRQLCQYREALENPPLLVVCDIARTEIHTNFTGTAKQVHIVELERISEPASLALLRRVFTDPESFKPTLAAESEQLGVVMEAEDIADEAVLEPATGQTEE